LRKLVWIKILILIICLIPGNTLVRSEPLPTVSGKAPEPPDVQVVLADTIRAFSLYSSFLSDCTEKNDALIPLHGSTRAEALSYLNQGFTPKMSEAIIDECTLWNDSLGALTIVPGDGIPVLTVEDTEEIRLHAANRNKITLLRKYNNCYTEGDEYLLLVTMIPDHDAWKISELSFNCGNENN